MVVWVVVFSTEGYKIREIFGQKSIYSKKMIVFSELTFFSKSAEIVLSKSIFHVKNRQKIFKKKIHLRISI